MTCKRALMLRRLLGMSLVAVLTATAWVAVDQSHAQGGSTWRFKQSEKCLMRKINRFRARRGRARLRWDKQVGVVARRHARKMARHRSIWHDRDFGRQITRWRRLGQNTGRSRNCRRIFRSFARSYTHRRNMLRRWRFMGVGTAWAGGRLYVQEVFESRRDPGNIWHYP